MIWRELRRRKVPQTCAFYLVGVWVAIQAADVLLPAFGYESSDIPRYLLYASIALFPLVVIAAWFFQVSPEGLQRADHFEERRQLDNIPPLNTRRTTERSSVARPPDYDWVLAFESGPLEGLRYPIAKSLTIGRARDCDLTLVSAHVSRHHARLVPMPDKSLVLEDLESANGTRLNGKKIQGQQVVRAGDMITIETIQFRISESYARAQGPDSAMNEQTVMAATTAMHPTAKPEGKS